MLPEPVTAFITKPVAVHSVYSLSRISPVSEPSASRVLTGLDGRDDSGLDDLDGIGSLDDPAPGEEPDEIADVSGTPLLFKHIFIWSSDRLVIIQFIILSVVRLSKNFNVAALIYYYFYILFLVLFLYIA